MACFCSFRCIFISCIINTQYIVIVMYYYLSSHHNSWHILDEIHVRTKILYSILEKNLSRSTKIQYPSSACTIVVRSHTMIAQFWDKFWVFFDYNTHFRFLRDLKQIVRSDVGVFLLQTFLIQKYLKDDKVNPYPYFRKILSQRNHLISPGEYL